MNKTVAYFAVVAMAVAALLAGCGGGGSGVAPTPNPPGPGDDRSVASGYVYVNDGDRAARPDEAPERMMIVRERLGDAGLRPLVGATVSLADRIGAWLTNAEGYFEIPDVPEGECEIIVVPPPDEGVAPGTFGIVAGPRFHPGGPPPGPPPIDPGDQIFVLPPHAAVEAGDVVQFYAMTL